MATPFTAVIHYQSPESDPLKVPRPTRITADADGELIATGGEGDLRGDKLIGLSRVDGPPPTFDPEDWVDARDILDADPAEAAEWAGWFPTFLAPESGIYTWSGAMDRVEVILGAPTALAGPEMEAWAKDLLMTDPNKIGR